MSLFTLIKPLMKNTYFNTVVKKILKYKNKLTSIETMKLIIQNILDTEYSDQKMYKMVYYLKNKWYIENLKKNVFFIKDPEKKYTQEQLTEMFYRTLVKKHCKEFLKGKWYIGGLKALELNMSSYDIPEEILIINEYKQATETVIYNKQALFKTYMTGDKNVFPFFFKLTRKIYIGKNIFDIATMEVAILEALYNPSMINKNYAEELIKKIIRKNIKTLDTKVWEHLLRNNKHHSSINRLYKLAQGIDPEFAETIKNIIKRFSYFIG